MTLKDFIQKHGEIEIDEEKEKQLKEILGIKEIKKSKKWKPELNERYYIVTTRLTVGEAFYTVHDEINDARLFVNNCFKTKEEAEFHLEKLKVYHELKLFADDNNEEIDWKNEEIKKWFFYFDHSTLVIHYDYYFHLQHIGDIYFSSKELAEQAIEKVGEDRIKKYLFGVEEC